MKNRIGYATMLLVLPLSVPAVRAANILGIDVSAYQGSINWTSVHSDGVAFAYAKATEGTYLEDADYHTNMTKGKSAGIQMGAYEFSRPDLDTPAEEATYFWNYAGTNITADGKSLMPAITAEVFDGYMGASSYTQWFNKWAADIVKDGEAAGVTLRPVVIGDCTTLCSFNSNLTLGFWIIDYNGENLYTGGPSCDCTSGVATSWIYWQVSDTGSISGIAGDVDLDAFDGSLAQLKANEGVTAY